MRLRFHVALFAACLSAAAQGRGSVSDLVAEVRDELRHARGDSRVAKDLRKMHFPSAWTTARSKRCRAKARGPRRWRSLLLLRDRSSRLPRPAAPAIPEPPAPSAAEQVQIWNAAHDNALRYTESLPDFICSEVVRRYTDLYAKGEWKLEDTLALKLTYFDRREEYKLTTVNNRPTGLSYEQLRRRHHGGRIRKHAGGDFRAEIAHQSQVGPLDAAAFAAHARLRIRDYVGELGLPDRLGNHPPRPGAGDGGPTRVRVCRRGQQDGGARECGGRRLPAGLRCEKCSVATGLRFHRT